MAKRVVKKSASAPRPKPSTMAERVHPDALENPEANSAVIESGSDNSGPAKRIAKVVNFTVSVGDDDRGRTIEKMIADLEKAIGAVPHGKVIDKNGKRVPGYHLTRTGGYYILDGKVCRPDDYDSKRKAFKKGATPPTWAGGPKTGTSAVSGLQRQMDYDLANLTPDEYDKKYKIGKYAPKPDMSKVITPAMQQAHLAELRAAKEEELEEFDWDLDDVNDETLGAVADASASRAVKKMTSTKRVVKKKPPVKKTVRRVKK